MTESLLLLVIAYCHAALCCCSSSDCLHVPRLCVDSLTQFVCAVGNTCRTVRHYIIDAVASGGSRPGADRNGIDFRVHVRIPWSAPESVVTLDSPGVVLLDTSSRVPDVLGLRTRGADAELVRVLPGGALECVGF